MVVTIDLSDESASLLESRARAAAMPAERYLAEIVERALASQRRLAVERLHQALEYLGSQECPEGTVDEMEEALDEALAEVRTLRSWKT